MLQIAAGPYHTLAPSLQWRFSLPIVSEWSDYCKQTLQGPDLRKVLMENGELMTFGSGASGRLGTGRAGSESVSG